MGVRETLAQIAHQERVLKFSCFDEEVSWALGCRVRDWAHVAKWPIVIDIRYFHRPLFFAALPGSSPDNVEWARRKINVVQRFHGSSYAMGQEMLLKDSTLEDHHGLSRLDFADHEGAFPLSVDGTGIIGCITLSGLPQREDHTLAVRALCDIQGRTIADFALPD